MTLSERLQEIRTGFDRPFWVANLSEIFERLSYYAVFAALARYLHEALQFPTQEAASLSGIFGGAATAISKEWTRAVLGVPAMNYSELLPRSVDFDPFLPLLSAAYPDERLHTLLVQLNPSSQLPLLRTWMQMISVLEQ